MADARPNAAKSTPAKKTTAKKTTAKKTTAKKTPAKKTPAKKTPAKKTSANKTSANKTSANKATGMTAATKAPATKATAGKESASKGGASGKTVAKGPRKKLGRVASSRKSAGAVSSRFFRKATDRARRLVEDPEALKKVADQSLKSGAVRSGPFAEIMDDFRTLIRLVVAYARGHYRNIPVDRLIIVVAGLIYVVSPLDLIPDAVPVGGFADDAVVVAWVIRSVRGELDAFRAWELGDEATPA